MLYIFYEYLPNIHNLQMNIATGMKTIPNLKYQFHCFEHNLCMIQNLGSSLNCTYFLF